MPQPKPNTTRRSARRSLGAVMVETVLVMPFILFIIVLIIYLGWNFRRQAQVTNMDRYVVWKQTTPGASGPDTQRLPTDLRNPRLNNAFYQLTSDQAIRLDERDNNGGYLPKSYETLRQMQADETYSYFDAFLDRSPRAHHERFTAQHEQINDMLAKLGMADITRAAEGHGRLNGDWRYANGIRYDGQSDRWKPAHYRVSPGSAMREVFFVDLDDGLEPYDNSGNKLAQAIREFYLSYPGYRGPDVTRDSLNRIYSDPDNNAGGGVGGAF